ncbi:MAG: polyphosphate kinase 1 [Oligoflexia bacterium]|nr:polyphosphate kinase 1 [Oligoflexia bacterium]
MKPSLLFNRELSWMAFNDRVLEEAQDKGFPLLERLKFVAIVSSNLDEFFMIRVAGLERKAKQNPNFKQVDGSKAVDTLYQIREWTLAQKRKQAEVLKEVLSLLQKQDLNLQTEINTELDKDVILKFPHPKIQFFTNIDGFKSHPGGQIFVFVKLHDRFAVMSMPENTDRLVVKNKHHFILAEKLMASAASYYFPNETVLEAFPFKIIRDADFKIAADIDPEELIPKIEAALQNRARLPAVRLEVDAASITDGALSLAKALKLPQRSIYRYDLPLDLRVLWRIHAHEDFDHLRFPKNEEDVTPRSMKLVPDLVKLVEGHDILLHHPYDSFDIVVKLLESAAQDKNVVAIRQTLYRSGKNSPIAKALMDAAKAGKNVSVLIEFRARFDEDTNIKLAKEFKKCGIKVLKGMPDKKIHCKTTQIIRREGDEVTSYVHMGTGNYNPSTARSYTDLSMLTTHEGFGRDAEKLFKAFESGRLPRLFENFVTAPEQLHKKLTQWVRSEARRALDGDKTARIIAKMNSLVDPAMVAELYEASKAGVKVDLIVRGACVLRPGVVGLSENINVISIVDKYLEHSRIYYFKNGEHPLIYLSSADWMPRSFHRRIEIAFPVEEAELKTYVKDIILETYLKDNVKARVLQPDGRWLFKTKAQGEESFRAQEYFERLAKQRYKGTPLYGRFVKQKSDQLVLTNISGAT